MGARILIIGLLLLNALIFMLRGEYNDGFDSLAWISLMGLYEIESQQRIDGLSLRDRLRPLRSLAILVVVFAETSYLFEGAWLDVVYSVQWLFVIALVELETRQPHLVRVHLRRFKLAAFTLALSMALVVGVWFSQGLLFNGYDALIWMLAFILIDLDLVKHRDA